MLKVDRMFLTLKMDRLINTDKHFLFPGGYELRFGNGKTVAFDFIESYGNVNKVDKSVVQFELSNLDIASFPEAVKLADYLVGSKVAEIVECYIDIDEEDGNEEINPLAITEMFFLISDGENEITVEIGDKILSTYHFDRFTAIPMKPEEVLYSYKNSQQISSQTGLIGYLRADMGTNGIEFWSTWNDFRKDLKIDAFKSEFDDVINFFREKGQFLSDRQTLSCFCDDTQKALKFGERYGTGRDYGVRVNTQDYTYLMRLNPHKGEYNLYCYCYRKDWLDSHLAKAMRGIRFIDSHYNEQFRIPDGDRIRIIYPDDQFAERTCRYIDDYHLEVGSNLYHICEFAEIMESHGKTVIPLRSSLPEHCYVYLLTENRIGIVKKGESGYYKTDLLESNNIKSHDEAESFVDELNGKLGVTRAQREAMMAGSMFGWHTPAADPKIYDKRGHIKR